MRLLIWPLEDQSESASQGQTYVDGDVWQEHTRVFPKKKTGEQPQDGRVIGSLVASQSWLRWLATPHVAGASQPASPSRPPPLPLSPSPSLARSHSVCAIRSRQTSSPREICRLLLVGSGRCGAGAGGQQLASSRGSRVGEIEWRRVSHWQRRVPAAVRRRQGLVHPDGLQVARDGRHREPRGRPRRGL